MAQWKQINGAWILINPSTSNAAEPVAKGLDWGKFSKGPAGFVHGPNPDRNRKFDKVTDDQIKALEKEDDERRNKEKDCEPLIREAKKDLAEGKIRIDPEVIKEKDKKINLFGQITDSRGITHVLPKYKLPEAEQKAQFDPKSIEDGKRGEGPDPLARGKDETLEQYYARLKQHFKPKEEVSVTMGRSVGGFAGPEPRDQIEQAFHKAKLTPRSALRGNTF